MSYVPKTGSKVCRCCGNAKEVHEFRVFRVYGASNREYRRSWCRPCERAYGRAWRRRNPGYHAEWSRRYRALGANN
jgi:hypothetical protein